MRIIYRLSFLLSTLFLGLALSAQLTINFGIKGGANFATFLGEDAGEVSSLVGPYGGALVRFSGSNDGILSYAVQSELLYSAQGAKSDIGKAQLSYINIPILVQRYIAGTGFHIESGPQLGFLLSSKTKIGGVTTDAKDGTKGFDFSWQFGLGYVFNPGIGINVRYGLGLTSISKDDDVILNAGISAGLFYVFGHSGE